MNLDYESLARQYNLSTSAIQHLAHAIANGNGQIAQFNHPELGGMGQWMPGMIMIGDAFNHTLKAKVDALSHELAEAYKKGSLTGASQFQSMESHWWSTDLQNPTTTGGQNNIRYAYFANQNRLVVMQNNKESVYDTISHTITGVSQQQSGNNTILVFHTKEGKTLSAENFKIVEP